MGHPLRRPDACRAPGGPRTRERTPGAAGPAGRAGHAAGGITGSSSDDGYAPPVWTVTVPP
jgi:hypothetical protein